MIVCGASQENEEESPEGYLNWDNTEQRMRILKKELPPVSLWVFDELHKYRKLRNYLKGIYDVKPKSQHILGREVLGLITIGFLEIHYKVAIII